MVPLYIHTYSRYSIHTQTISKKDYQGGEGAKAQMYVIVISTRRARGEIVAREGVNASHTPLHKSLLWIFERKDLEFCLRLAAVVSHLLCVYTYNMYVCGLPIK